MFSLTSLSDQIHKTNTKFLPKKCESDNSMFLPFAGNASVSICRQVTVDIYQSFGCLSVCLSFYFVFVVFSIAAFRGEMKMYRVAQ